MASWTDQDAQARFGARLDRCLEEGPQIRSTLKELLLADEARIDLPLPHRRAKRRRGPTALGHKPSTS